MIGREKRAVVLATTKTVYLGEGKKGTGSRLSDHRRQPLALDGDVKLVQNFAGPLIGLCAFDIQIFTL